MPANPTAAPKPGSKPAVLAFCFVDMMRLVSVLSLVFVLVLADSERLCAQFGEDGNSPGLDSSLSLNNIYVELAGPGIVYSINYDRQLGNSESIRLGFGYYNSGGGTTVEAIPLTVSWFPRASSWESNKIEFGLGIDYVRWIDRSDDWSSLCPTAMVGYRYQPADGCFLFRIGFTPMYFTGKTELSKSRFTPWGGMSFGSSF